MLINSPNISGSLTVSGNSVITGSLTVLGGIEGAVAGTATTASYVEFNNVANKPTLVSGSSQITYSGLTGIPLGIVSGSSQIVDLGFATTGSNSFDGNQIVTGSLTVTGDIVAQTLNVQQVTSSVVYSSGSNIFGNSLANTHEFTGSLSVTGSLLLNGNPTILGTGTRTTDYIPKFGSDTNQIQNSQIFDNGTDVGIGTSSPTQALTVQKSSFPIIDFYDGATGRGDIGYNAGTTSFNIGAYGAIPMVFYVNSAERLRITSGGNVLINSTSDNGARLQVSGTATFSDTVTLNGSNNVIRSGNELRFNRTDNLIYTRLYDAGSTFVLDNRNGNGFSFESAGTPQMTITSGGVLRLNAQATYGTLTYEQTLQYATSPAGIFFANSFNSNNNVELQLRTSNDGTGVAALTLSSTGVSTFRTPGTGSAVIIRHFDGTNNPGLFIETVESNKYVRLTASGSSVGGQLIQLGAEGNAGVLNIGSTNVLIGTTTDNGYLLRTGDKGTSSTNAYFGTGTVRIGGGADGGFNQVLSIAPGIVGIDAPGVGNGRFIVNGVGNVGIGTANPRVRAEFFVGLPTTYPDMADRTHGILVSDNGAIGGRIGVADRTSAGQGYPTYIQAGDLTTTDLYYELRLNPNGGAVFAGSSRLDNISDERVKDNVQPITNSLSKVLQLNGKKFHLKDEPQDKIRYGFIAQDLEGILDEFIIQTDTVFTKDELVVKDIKSIENWASSWAALLVEAIKELKSENDTLKSRIEALENQ